MTYPLKPKLSPAQRVLNLFRYHDSLSARAVANELTNHHKNNNDVFSVAQVETLIAALVEQGEVVKTGRRHRGNALYALPAYVAAKAAQAPRKIAGSGVIAERVICRQLKWGRDWALS